MKKLSLISLNCCLVVLFVSSQNDTVFHRKEGLYLDYIQFRENKPILKHQIISDIDTTQLDFFTKIIAQRDILILKENNEKVKILPKEVWGYFQNNILYINQDNTFYKVPVLGAISYFIGTQEITYYSNMGIGVGYPYAVGFPVKSREVKDFLLDYYTGKVYPFSIEQLEELLKKDDDIYREFVKLTRKQKKKKYSYYIRKFNQKHKVY